MRLTVRTLVLEFTKDEVFIFFVHQEARCVRRRCGDIVRNTDVHVLRSSKLGTVETCLSNSLGEVL